MGHQLTVAPTLKAVNVGDVKSYLYVTEASDDRLISDLIMQGTQFLENRYRIAVMTQTWELSMDGFQDPRYWRHGAIHIGRPPLGTVSSVQYVDDDGNTQTFAAANYRVSSDDVTARIELAPNASWPSTDGVIDDVTITHTAGYASADDVPFVVRQAIKDYCFAKYHNRGCGDMGGVEMTTDALMGGLGVEQYA